MSYWCYQCNRLVNVSDEDTLTCPRCNSGFIEAGTGPSSASVSPPESRRNSDGSAGVRLGFGRNGAETEMYNPIILLRSPNQAAGGDVSDGVESSDGSEGGGERLYRLFYDGGAGTGLQPLPPSMSEFLLGAGFDRLLEQLSQLEINKPENGPASKAAIESIPSVVIEPSHDCSDLSCVICHEEFDIGSEAREMPCKHLYHSECIVWKRECTIWNYHMEIT
ncbi:hypothetical protein Leryth_010670 [Lithospermum erythrorhizon]|nr:hypothetical protein Leryth_010670 [Lithospermum erythrorhizon]